ncbi:amidohydrolase family protein [Arthrobacter sp. AK04]|jgi:predicted TIM-barrel fold metal-dependent hydrolase|uniref:amidohydrolase family protein n=1 Tax=unclassified Arthrobacter TaxID=235627 RepID=UPI0006F9A4F3|nr:MULTISPECIES: amidohydrolase family protein [unclassified Arthrobacter]KQR64165.1 hypothetical protein ASF98_11765 [Arthrobacter sp. Leaf337]MCD5341865.1 amidohydrolase family protein [Arthrobacter sp. AK04]
MFRASAPLVDTHAHIFYRGLTPTANARYVPHYDATLDQYLSVLTAHGVARGVLVQPSFLGSDNSYLLTALAAEPDRLRGVVVVDDATLQCELSEERVRALDAAGVRGVRLNLVGQPVPDLFSASWMVAGEVMADSRWHLEIQASGQQWLELAPALSAWPTKLVIDHLGLPKREHPGAIEAVLNLAGLDKCWVKVSAPYRSSYDQAESIFSLFLKRGSTDRLLYGSDWPFTRHEDNGYPELLAWARKLAGEELLNRMMTTNAYTLLEWPAESDNLVAEPILQRPN